MSIRAKESAGRQGYQAIIGAYGGPEAAMQAVSLSPAGIEGLQFTDPISGRVAWMSPEAVAAFDGNAGANGFILSDDGTGNQGLWHPEAGVITGAELAVQRERQRANKTNDAFGGGPDLRPFREDN